MDMAIFRTRAKETKDQVVGFFRRHWKEIALGATIVVSAIAVYVLSKGEADAETFARRPDETDCERKPFPPEAAADEPSESTRDYHWYEDSHPVREHTRLNSDGSTSLVRGYTKVTGGRINAGDQGGENSSDSDSDEDDSPSCFSWCGNPAYPNCMDGCSVHDD